MIKVFAKVALALLVFVGLGILSFYAYLKGLGEPQFILHEMYLDGIDLEFRNQSTWSDDKGKLFNTSSTADSHWNLTQKTGLLENLESLFQSKVMELELTIVVRGTVVNPYPISLKLNSAYLKVIALAPKQLEIESPFTLEQVKSLDSRISLLPVYVGPLLQPIEIFSSANTSIALPMKLVIPMNMKKMKEIQPFLNENQKCIDKAKKLQVYSSVFNISLSLGAFNINREGLAFEQIAETDCPPMNLPKSLALLMR